MKKIMLGIVIASFLLAPVAITGFSVIQAATEEELENLYPPVVNSAAPQVGGEAFEVPTTDLMATLGNIADWIFYILIAVAVLFIVIAGIEYTTAQGDPEKIKAAGQKVLYALIGIIVAALAKGLVILVQYFPKAP